jgi:hypothetical protein
MSSSDSSQDDQQHTNGNSKYSSAAVQLAQLQNNGCKNAFLSKLLFFFFGFVFFLNLISFFKFSG